MEKYIWDYIDPLLDEGLYRVVKDGKWGCVDEAGKPVIACRWDYIGGFWRELIFVKKDGFWGVLRRDDTLAILCCCQTLQAGLKDPDRIEYTKDGKQYSISISEL
jgi:hypothetical protein